MSPRTPPALAGLLMLLAALPASAAWVLPPGAEAALGGGAVSLGCADVATQAGALLDLDGARLELAGQWTAAGQLSASGAAQVLRTASPGCPVAGLAGPVPLGGAPAIAPTPVPALGSWALALLALAIPALAGRARKTRSSR